MEYPGQTIEPFSSSRVSAVAPTTEKSAAAMMAMNLIMLGRKTMDEINELDCDATCNFYFVGFVREDTRYSTLGGETTSY